MPALTLPDPATPASTFQALADGGALSGRDPVVLKVQEGDDLVVAMQWIVSELLENVFLHAATDQPAAICAQHLPNGRRIDLAICDVGQGLRASLAKNRPVTSAGHAIDLAVERGVSVSAPVRPRPRPSPSTSSPFSIQKATKL